jgi:hypothetical protein
MPQRKQENSGRAPRTGYSHLARIAVQETTLRVKKMRRAIADKSFNIVRRIPLVSGPARLIRTAHDAISAAVDAASRHSSGGLVAATAMVEKQHTGGPH